MMSQLNFDLSAVLSMLYRKPVLILVLVALLSSISVGVLPAYLSEEMYLLILPALISIFILLSDCRFVILLWLCPLIFFFAQFQLLVFDLTRWILLFMLVLLSANIIRKDKLSVNPAALGLGIVAVYSVAISGLSYYPTISLMKSVSLLLFSLFILFIPPAISRLHPDIGAKRYILNMYLWFAILAVITNAVYYLLTPSASFLAGRYRGWFVNPNGIGAVYGIFFLPVLWAEVGKHRMGLIKLALILILFIATIELLASQSRAGILTGIISLLTLVLGQRSWPSRILVISMILLLVSIIYFNNPGNNPLRRFIYRNEVSLQGSDRLAIWSGIWDRFADKPLFGSGLGVSDTGLKESGFSLSSVGYTIEKSNSYLGVLEELGLVGVVIMTLTLALPMLFFCWQELKKSYLVRNSSNLVLIAIIAAGLFNTFFEAWLLSVGSILTFSFWIFVALLFYNESNSLS